MSAALSGTQYPSVSSGLFFGLLFLDWGSTWLAREVGVSVVPTATLILCVGYGRVRWSAATVAALVLGAAGLRLLIGPDFRFGRLAAIAAAAAGAAAYAWGGILTKERPEADAVAFAGWQNLLGGELIALAGAIAEPVRGRALASFVAGLAVGNLRFLVLASVIGGVVYLVLLARWEPSEVAAYACVCPLIAVAEGWAVGARWPGWNGRAAVLLLLIATQLRLTVTPVRGDTG